MSISTDSVTQDPKQAAAWLRSGWVIAYPSESVWGLGCDPFNKQAAERILQLKERRKAKGMIVVAGNVQRVAPLFAMLNEPQRQHVYQSWSVDSLAQADQAQTWLLPLPNQLPVTIPDWIRGEHHSVALRVIAHPLIQQLCANMVSPANPYGLLVSTSANLAGQPPATNFTQAHAYFGHSVAYLQADTLGYTKPSRICDAISGNSLR